jgi:hypothetical protein
MRILVAMWILIDESGKERIFPGSWSALPGLNLCNIHRLIMVHERGEIFYSAACDVHVSHVPALSYYEAGKMGCVQKSDGQLTVEGEVTASEVVPSFAKEPS